MIPRSLRDRAGTIAARRLFPSRDDRARQDRTLDRLDCGDRRARLVRAGRGDLGRALHRHRRTDRLERRQCRSGKWLLHLPWPRRAWQWRRRAAAGRARRRLHGSAARSLCRRPPAARIDVVDLAAAERDQSLGGLGLLCRFAPRATSRRSAAADAGLVGAGRSGARPAGLRRLSRPCRTGARPRQPAARRSAGGVSRRADRPVAPGQAANRSWQCDARDQPAPDASGSLGSLGLCGVAARGCSSSGTCGSIPRRTSWRSQK